MGSNRNPITSGVHYTSLKDQLEGQPGQKFTSRSEGNIKLVHQLDVGAARRSSAESEEQFKHKIKSRGEMKRSSAECSNRITSGVHYTSLNDQLKDQLEGQPGQEQTKNQLVKDKPAGNNLQEQIMKGDLSSEDDEDQLEIRSADKSKLEELLKSS
ncbi:hypothetical protein F511_25447 [Dorcoceras hygrometricum]|uniref:Uncharacterized protein n=1 Tax=Dorcoceras hygrometricum TaxID=472368 RepID=A0A2Z7A8Z6_9LAMI|nr:hypothetical protein F511_25447 [Dorcoceras hygrometricum]